MSAAPTIAVLTNRPDPQPDRPVAGAEAPTRTGRLLCVLRKLIDYGRNLAGTLQQRISPTSLATVTRHFGTADIALILAYIARALHRAVALEAWVIGRVGRVDSPDAWPARASAPSHRQPSAAKPAEQRAYDADPRLAGLPTQEELTAEFRRRPIGAVLADICRDLGIIPSNPLWRELALVIGENGGNVTRLFRDIGDRMYGAITDPPALAPPALPAPCAPLAPASGAGPP
jgi:hypothetical protein